MNKKVYINSIGKKNKRILYLNPKKLFLLGVFVLLFGVLVSEMSMAYTFGDGRWRRHHVVFTSINEGSGYWCSDDTRLQIYNDNINLANREFIPFYRYSYLQHPEIDVKAHTGGAGCDWTDYGNDLDGNSWDQINFNGPNYDQNIINSLEEIFTPYNPRDLNIDISGINDKVVDWSPLYGFNNYSDRGEVTSYTAWISVTSPKQLYFNFQCNKPCIVSLYNANGNLLQANKSSSNIAAKINYSLYMNTIYVFNIILFDEQNTTPQISFNTVIKNEVDYFGSQPPECVPYGGNCYGGESCENFECVPTADVKVNYSDNLIIYPGQVVNVLWDINCFGIPKINKYKYVNGQRLFIGEVGNTASGSTLDIPSDNVGDVIQYVAICTRYGSPAVTYYLDTANVYVISPQQQLVNVTIHKVDEGTDIAIHSFIMPFDQSKWANHTININESWLGSACNSSNCYLYFFTYLLSNPNVNFTSGRLYITSETGAGNIVDAFWANETSRTNYVYEGDNVTAATLLQNYQGNVSIRIYEEDEEGNPTLISTYNTESGGNWANKTINTTQEGMIAINCNIHPFVPEHSYYFEAIITHGAGANIYEETKRSNDLVVCQEGTGPPPQYSIKQAFWANVTTGQPTDYVEENGVVLIKTKIWNYKDLIGSNVTIHIIQQPSSESTPLGGKGGGIRIVPFTILNAIKDFISNIITGKITDETAITPDSEINITIGQDGWASIRANVTNLEAIDCNTQTIPYYLFNASLSDYPQISKLSNNLSVCKQGTIPLPEPEVNIVFPVPNCQNTGDEDLCCIYEGPSEDELTPFYNVSKSIWHNITANNYDSWSIKGYGAYASENLSASGEGQIQNKSHVYGIIDNAPTNNYEVHITATVENSQYQKQDNVNIWLWTCQGDVPIWLNIISPENKTYTWNQRYMDLNASVYTTYPTTQFTWMLFYNTQSSYALYFDYSCIFNSENCPNTSTQINIAGQHLAIANASGDSQTAFDDVYFTISPSPSCSCEDPQTPCGEWNYTKPPPDRFCNASSELPGGTWVNYCLTTEQCNRGGYQGWVCFNYRCVQEGVGEECYNQRTEDDCIAAICWWKDRDEEPPCRTCEDARDTGLGCSAYVTPDSCEADVCNLGGDVTFDPSGELSLGCEWKEDNNGNEECVLSTQHFSPSGSYKCYESVESLGDCLNNAPTRQINYSYTSDPPQYNIICCNDRHNNNCGNKNWYIEEVACPQPETMKMPGFSWVNVVAVLLLLGFYYVLRVRREKGKKERKVGRGRN